MSVPPSKNTSNAGKPYEVKVGAWYTLLMLAGIPPFAEELGRIEDVLFQGKVDGWLLDDLVLTLAGKHGKHRVSISVKSNPQFTKTTAPADFVELSWKQILGKENTKFKESEDYVGLVTTPLAPDFVQDLEFLCSHSARAQRDKIPARMITEGFSSKRKRALYQSFRCPEDLLKDAPTDDEPARLLARAKFMEFDFDQEDSQATTKAISTCQELLIGADRQKAHDMWLALLEVVSDTQTPSGNLNRLDVVKHLYKDYRLKDWPDHIGDWEHLRRSRQRVMSQVQDSIAGEVELPHTRQVQKITDTLKTSDHVTLWGGAGTGKSSALKKWAQQSPLPVLWFDGAELAYPGFEAFHQALGLVYPLEELLQKSSQVGVLIIDGLDRQFDANCFKNGAHLIEIATKKAHKMGWKVILPCLDDEWSRVRENLGSVAREHWLPATLPEYNPQDLQPIWQRFPQAASFVLQPQLRSLLRNLKIIDLVVTHLPLERDDIPHFVGETEIIEWYWKHVIEKNASALRAELVKEISSQQTELKSSRVPRDGLQRLTALTELTAEGILVSADEQVWFSHDLLGDWSRFRILLGKTRQARQDFMANPQNLLVWHRSIRLYAMHLLERKNTAAWTQELNHLMGSQNTLAVDLFLDAVFFATNSLKLLEDLWPVLKADGFHLYRRLLSRFFVLASQPDDLMLAWARSRQPENLEKIAALCRTPDLPRWAPMVQFVWEHMEELSPHFARELHQLADQFILAAPAGFPAADAAAHLALHLVRNISSLSDLWSIASKVHATALRAAFFLPDLVAEHALKLAGRTTLQDLQQNPNPIDTDPEVEALRPKSWLGDVRPAREPWPDGPRRRIDPEFRSAVHSDHAMAPLSLLRPAVAREVILASFIEDGRRRLVDPHDRKIEEIINPGHEWFPSWWIRGPFYPLISRNEAQGLECILRLVNFATERWAAKYPNKTTTLLQLENERLCLGDAAVFAWSRRHLNGHLPPPAAVIAALGALEKHLYTLLDNAKDINHIIDVLLERTNSVAILGVLVSLVKYQPKLLRHADLVTVVITPRIVEFERDLTLEEAFVYGRPQNADEAQAYLEWHKMPHRKHNLLHILVGSYAQDETIRSHLQKHREGLLALGDAQDQPGPVGALLVCTDPANYEIGEGKDWTRSFKFVPPEAHRAPSEATIPSPMEALFFTHHCRRILDGDDPWEDQHVEVFWAKIMQQERQLKDPNKGHLTLLAGVSVLMKKQPQWVFADLDRKTWCQNAVLNTLSEMLKLDQWDPEGKTGMSWDAFAVPALLPFWRDDLDHPEWRAAIAAVVLAGSLPSTGNLVEQAALFVGHQAPVFWQLRHFVLRVIALQTLIQAIKTRIDQSQAKTHITALQEDLRLLMQQFVAGEMSEQLPSLNDLQAACLQHWHRLGFREERLLEAQDILPAFSGWPAVSRLDETDLRQYTEENLQLLHFILPLPGSEATEFNPPEHEERLVLRSLGELTAHLSPSERPERLWEPLLRLGKEAEEWVVPYLQGFMGTLLSFPAIAEAQILNWNALQGQAFKTYQPIGRGRHSGAKVMAAVMGVDRSTVKKWGVQHQKTIANTLEMWETWGNQVLLNPDNCADFARFLRQPAADALREQGLRWLHLKSKDQSEHWWQHCSKEVLELLRHIWKQRNQRSITAEEKKSFDFLLLQLNWLQIRDAILLSGEVGEIGH